MEPAWPRGLEGGLWGGSSACRADGQLWTPPRPVLSGPKPGGHLDFFLPFPTCIGLTGP